VWFKTAWQPISTEVTVQGFKMCIISNAKGGTDGVCCGMALKRMGRLGVSVRKMKALNVKIKRVTLISKDRQNLTCIMYLVCEVNSGTFF
jgi:hypothetical protein